MTGKPPWREIALRVVACLACLGLAWFAYFVGLLFASGDPLADGVVFATRSAPALVLLVGALLALLRPGWSVAAFLVAGVLAMFEGFGVYSTALLIPARFLVPGLLAE